MSSKDKAIIMRAALSSILAECQAPVFITVLKDAKSPMRVFMLRVRKVQLSELQSFVKRTEKQNVNYVQWQSAHCPLLNHCICKIASNQLKHSVKVVVIAMSSRLLTHG